MAARRYETLVVMHPDLGEPGSKELAAKIQGIIESQGGTLLSPLQEWGLRELSYLVDKQRRGFYVLFEFRASPAGLAELERQLRIMDPVLRHISVRQDDDAPLAVPPRGARSDVDESEDVPSEADAVQEEGA